MALRMGMLLAKTGPIREAGNASVMTYSRRKSKQSHAALLVREEEKVRTCERNNMETPRSVEKEGQEVLQVPELRFLCSLWCSQ